ncbi:MAG: hypothetical protein AAB907_02840 [Patescibacteria group bacterium]
MDQIIAFLSGNGEFLYLMFLIIIVSFGGITFVNMFREGPREDPKTNQEGEQLDPKHKQRIDRW